MVRNGSPSESGDLVGSLTTLSGRDDMPKYLLGPMPALGGRNEVPICFRGYETEVVRCPRLAVKPELALYLDNY